MNRTVKKATMWRCHASSYEQLRARLADFAACDYARRRKTLRG